MARLLSVNVGLPREMAWKAKLSERRMVRKLNIDGDASRLLALPRVERAGLCESGFRRAEEEQWRSTVSRKSQHTVVDKLPPCFFPFSLSLPQWVPMPENAYESVIVPIGYKSYSLGSPHPLRDDFSTKQIRDSTALSGTHFLLLFRVCRRPNFLIHFVPSVVILWTFAVSLWTKWRLVSVGARVVLANLVWPEQFERFVPRSLSPSSDRLVPMWGGLSSKLAGQVCTLSFHIPDAGIAIECSFVGDWCRYYAELWAGPTKIIESLTAAFSAS